MAYTDNFVADVVSLVDSLEAAEKLEFSNLLFTKSFGVDSIEDSHTVVNGVRQGNLIPILKDNPDYESFPFVDENACVITDCDLDSEYSTHAWDLGLMECRVGICMRSFNESFNLFWKQYKQTQEGDADLDTAFLQYLGKKFNTNLEAAKWRAAYFGDTASLSAYFNRIDGFFTQMEAGNADQVIEIAKNDGATFALQKMTGEEVYNTLAAMYNRAGEYPWFDDTIMGFKITRAMGAALVTWLNSLSDLRDVNCDCYSPDNITAKRRFTLDGLRVFGLPVSVRPEFDGVINGTAELNGGGGAAARINPNRAILTYRDNLLIGTTEVDALQSFDVWHSKDDKKIYLEGSSYIGAGLPMVEEYILAI